VENLTSARHFVAVLQEQHVLLVTDCLWSC